MTNETSKDLTPRQRAAERGDVYYLGSACNKCGKKKRYVLGGNCTACMSTRAKESRRRISDLRKTAREVKS